ncbi:MAG TPA: hypothetical protein VIV40_30550 [Kofleriaceae bacterium]
MTRKQFLGTMIGAAGAAALVGCGGDDGGGGLDGAITRNCAMNGTSVTIESNHGHVLVVSSSDVTTGADKTYDIMGTATHTHSVTVTAADFAKLQSNANASVMVTSTVGGAHTHAVTILCA